MTITFGGEHERLINEKIVAGADLSPEHLAAEALKLLAARDERERQLDALRRDVELGWQQAERGELLPGPAAMAELVGRAQRRLPAA